MPAELFRSVAGRRRAAGHRLSAVPLSIAFHAVLLAAVVVVPIVAVDPSILPSVTRSIEFTPPSVPVVTVPPPAPPRSRRTAVPQAAGPATPLVPPRGIPQNSGLAQQPEVTDVPPRDTGVIDGITSDDHADVLVPPPPPPPATPQRPVRISEVRPPLRTHYEPPIYPQPAILAHVQGTVTIEAIISTTGAVEDARVLGSVPLLDDAALAAVRRWVYRPTTLNGVPVPVIMTVKVEFKLR